MLLLLAILASAAPTAAASGKCFAQTLHGYIFYGGAECSTNTDCVNQCDCGAVCLDTHAGCNISTPDTKHICPYLHAKDGAGCKVSASGSCVEAAPGSNAAASTTTSAAALPPVVLVPGLAGSVFRVKLQDTKPPHAWCSKTSDWFVTWLNLEELVPLQKDCLLWRLGIGFSPDKGGLYNTAAGVSLDTNVDFGNVGGVSTLDPTIPSAMPYFSTMIKNLTGQLGYVAGQNLHGAGFDWRLGPLGHAQPGTEPSDPGGFYAKLKALVEGTVARNNGTKAVIVTHSLGGPTILAFLHWAGAAWVDAHVGSFVPISSPWAGAARMALTEVGGDNLGIPVVPHDYLKPVQQAAESGVFLLPAGDAAWGGGAAPAPPIVSTPSRNYTVGEIPDMLRDLGLNETAALYAALAGKQLLAGQLPPPPGDDLEVHQIYSTGVKTGLAFTYPHDFDDPAKPTDLAPTATTEGDGDGTVNLCSLKWAEESWGPGSGTAGGGEEAAAAAPHLTTFVVKGVSHFDAVKDPRVLGRVLEVIRGGRPT